MAAWSQGYPTGVYLPPPVMIQQPSSRIGKYYSVFSEGSSSIVINFKSIKIYETYRDIIFQNYDRNQFVQKNKDNDNGTIEYRFKFRGEEVCITLYHCTVDTVIHVHGNGGDTWWNEATGILDTQYEKLQSGELQIPGAETGKIKKPLVDEKDFRDCFAIPYAYGTNGKDWSHKTILLYKYSSNATSKYWDIPENKWKRIDNDEGGKHAEEKMIKDLENIQEYLTIQPDEYEGSYKAILSVEVISSYSPCDGCSWKLFHMKGTMDEKVKQSKTRNKDLVTVRKDFSALSLNTEIEDEIEVEEKVKFKITFSNFYKHIEKFDNSKQNMDGLKNLLTSDIKLDIFNDDNWHYFFNAAGLVTERQKREKDDKKILQYLEGLVTYERLPAALVAMEEDLIDHKLL